MWQIVLEFCKFYFFLQIKGTKGSNGIWLADWEEPDH